MKEVREKRGYAYSVYSYVAPRKLEGPFEIGLQTKREQVDDALKVVERGAPDFIAKGPTPRNWRRRRRTWSMAWRCAWTAMPSCSATCRRSASTAAPDLPRRFSGQGECRDGRTGQAAFARHVKAENLVTVVVAAD
jgi:zinc protease